MVVTGYIAFLAATYISDPVTTGSAYGFQIGQSKQATIRDVKALQRKYPVAVLDAIFGPRAGDHITLSLSRLELAQLEASDHWTVMLDGPDEFSNIVRLNFKNDQLIKIYRHRQFFELP